MPALLYISAILPARSETFVYREVFALRARGLTVHTASVHAPERDLGETRLDELAATAIPIYASGQLALLRDAALESFTHPIRATTTSFRAIADTLSCDDVPWPRRPRLLIQALAGLALARRIRRLGITHIHAHMAHVPATIAMVAARQLRIPFSFTGHANDLFPNRALLRPKVRRAAFVSCISRWHQSFYHGLTGIPLDRLPIIRCGVDVPPSLACGECVGRGSAVSTVGVCERESLEERASSPLGASTAAVHVVAVGRLIRKKGFDVLLDALALLHRTHPDLASRLRVSIAGDGPEVQALSAQAGQVCAQTGIPPTQVQLLGALPNPAVRALMGTADLFVLPCRIDDSGDRDGIPVVLMEAMAAAIPVISGRLPAIEELVEHEATGLMVPPGDGPALAQALVRILTDDALRARLAAAGRQRVINEFSEPVNIDRLLRAFNFRDDAAALRPNTGGARSIPEAA